MAAKTGLSVNLLPGQNQKLKKYISYQNHYDEVDRQPQLIFLNFQVAQYGKLPYIFQILKS